MRAIGTYPLLLLALITACENNTLDGTVDDTDADTVADGDPSATDADNDGVPDDEDCDSSDPSVGTLTFYADADDDGFGTDSDTVEGCDAPAGYALEDGDCDDTDAFINPGQVELCNDVDDDCNDLVDDDPADGDLYYPDSDNDSFGDPAVTVLACEPTDGVVADNTDCDDTDPEVYPGSRLFDIPGDGIDPNCDGEDVCNDLNCDGWVDMLVVESAARESGDYYVVAYMNDGGGYNDDDIVEFVFDSRPGGADVGDVDLDGYPDIAVAIDNEVRIMHGSADGYDQSTAEIVAGTSTAVRDVEFGDVDQDGFLDMLVNQWFPGNQGTGAHPILFAGTGGAYDPAFVTSYIPSRQGVGAWYLKDVDSDGMLDVVGFGRHPHAFASSNSFIGVNFFNVNVGGTTKGDFADLDGDGTLDYVGVYNQFNGNYPRSFVSSADIFANGSNSMLIEPDATNVGSQGSALGDFNGDGHLDMAGAGSSVFILMHTDEDGWAHSEMTELGDTVHRGVYMHSYDINGDGYDDLLQTRRANSGFSVGNYLWWGSEDGLSDANRTTVTTRGTQELVVADVNRDGLPDIIGLTYSGTGEVQHYIYLGDPTFSYAPTQRITITGAISWYAPILVGDSTW